MCRHGLDGRMTHSRNLALDGFRGLGCLLVMLGHTQRNTFTILPGAVVSMDLFFTLSGFLITGILYSEWRKSSGINLKNFWYRRAARLLPAFYVYFFIGATVYAITRFQPIVGTDAKTTLLSTGLYFSNWAVANGYNLGIFTVTWSLSMEEQFYLVFPLSLLAGLKFLSPKKLVSALVVFVFAFVVYRGWLFHDLLGTEGVGVAWRRCFYSLDTRADSFLIGAIFGLLYHIYGTKIPLHPIFYSLCFVLFFYTLSIQDFPIAYRKEENSAFTEFLMNGGLSLYAFFGAVLILGSIKYPTHIVTKILSWKPFVALGAISYSVYIWHTTVFGGLDIPLSFMEKSWPMWFLKIAIKFSVIIGIGYLSYRFIEKPILKRLTQSRKYSAIASTGDNVEKT